jgi:hypothetical protein
MVPSNTSNPVKITLEAVVDQDFAKATEPGKVDPLAFSGKPQLHLTQMRVLDSYEARQGTRVLRGGRILQQTVDE